MLGNPQLDKFELAADQETRAHNSSEDLWSAFCSVVSEAFLEKKDSSNHSPSLALIQKQL